MESDLICNFKKCRKKLRECAWVTSCSHVFCNDDGSREFQKSLICPACDTSLPGKYDIIRMELNPSEQYKSMILAGLCPDTVMDICSRAMSFWSYQVQQELNYQLYNVNTLTDRCNRLEQIYEQAAAKSKAENLALQKDLESSKQECENQKKYTSELMEKLAERNRQLQKVNTMYENVRRKCYSPVYCKKNSAGQPPQERQSFNIPLTTVEEVMGRSHMPAATITNDVFTQEMQTSTVYVQPENFKLNIAPMADERNLHDPHGKSHPLQAQFRVNF